jgi:putative Mn2+ efflux pump MntP
MQSPTLIEILLISVGLSLDAFSVALAAGAQGFKPRRVFRLSWHFGLFQFFMPVIGWAAGELIAQYTGRLGPWAIFLLMLGIGAKMISEGLKSSPKNIPDLSKGWNLVSLSFGTSFDALGVGFGFGLLNYDIIKPAVIIGLVCAMITIIGLYFGTKLYARLGHKALILGGMILIGIGVKFLI